MNMGGINEYLKAIEEKIVSSDELTGVIGQDREEELLRLAGSLSGYLKNVYTILSRIDKSRYRLDYTRSPGLAALVPTIGLVGLSQGHIRIQIDDEKERARGLGALLLKGKHDVLFLDNHMYGLTSEEQLILLEERGVSFTVIQES